MPFRFLEHTADALAECRGADVASLMRAAADAFYAVALQERRSDTSVERTVPICADTPADRVVRFLQELIFLIEVDRFVAVDVAFDHGPASDDAITRARLRGYICDVQDRAAEVKAATYHALDITRDQDGLVIRIVFDL